MKKKTVSIIFILTMLLSTCMIALAEEDAASIITSETTASLLKSKGAIVYQNGTDSVVIDSNDLYTLADAFDTYKAAIYWQMAEMNTYLTTEDEGIALTTSKDVHVVHSVPSDIVAPLSLNFDTLIEGVAASQSIPQTPIEYGYAEGTNLYKTRQGLLTTEASDNKEMIEIKGATADSLSAATAAWIDGELILGTGAENKAYYDMGYTDGLNKAMDGVHISYVYHEHSGNESSGGGCYTPRYIRYSIGAYAGSTNPSGTINYFCKACNMYLSNYREEHLKDVGEFLNNHRHYDCPRGITVQDGWSLGCGKTTSTIESATIAFN